MQLLQKCATLTKDKSEFKKNIYILFVRRILEQSRYFGTVHSIMKTLTILRGFQSQLLQEDYTDYIDGLFRLNIDTLSERGNTLCKNFAKETTKHEKLYNMYPKSEVIPDMKTKKHETFKVNMAFTERYKFYVIPQMQRLLNDSFTDEEYDKA